MAGEQESDDAVIAGNHCQHDTEGEKPQFGNLRSHRLQIIAVHKI